MSERLKYFSAQHHTSMTAICEAGSAVNPDTAICILAHKSPRNVIRLCEKIYAAQADIDADATLISHTAIDKGMLAYCEQVARNTYGEEAVKEMQRIGREVFTTNYLANDVFKIEANAVRNKITGWTSMGLVKQIGTLIVSSSKRPLNLYCVTDPAVVRMIHRNLTLDQFLKALWLPCKFCDADNLMSLDTFSEANTPLCLRCGRSLIE